MGQRKRIATLERREDEYALLCIRSEPHGMSYVGLEHDAYHAEEMTPEQLITEEKHRLSWAPHASYCWPLMRRLGLP
ncbi:hypothetical protein ZWY2020_007896 [Hordeum vulgare]|nr:hypothetical protein ZWY2020_007896 [Hordeum vulgare]